MLNKLFDNRFWYVGVTHCEFGDNYYENNPCVILRNPFGEWSPDKDKNCYCDAYKRAYQELQEILPKFYPQK